jgi:hypothetical protein
MKHYGQRQALFPCWLSIEVMMIKCLDSTQYILDAFRAVAPSTTAYMRGSVTTTNLNGFLHRRTMLIHNFRTIGVPLLQQ